MMKNWLFVFVLTFMSSLTTFAFSDEPQTKITVDDVKQLKEQVQTLKSIVNGDDEKKPVEQPKTMVNVADKALDMLSGAVGTVSETLKRIGPEVWRIMIRQQYADAAEMIVGPFFALIASIVVFFSTQKALTVKDYDSGDLRGLKGTMKFITYFVPCLCALFCAIQLSAAASKLINPEYYALKDLLGMMTGK